MTIGSGSYSYGTAQFKLDRTHVQQGHDMTHFSFHTCATEPACARKIGDVKPTVQNSHVRTRRVHDVHVHVRNAHTKFVLRVQAKDSEINSMNMFMYPPHDTRHKSC